MAGHTVCFGSTGYGKFYQFYHLNVEDEPSNGRDNSVRKRFNIAEFKGSLFKYWRFNNRDVTWGMPFTELLMLGASIPKTDTNEVSTEKDVNKESLTGEQLFNRIKRK